LLPFQNTTAPAPTVKPPEINFQEEATTNNVGNILAQKSDEFVAVAFKPQEAVAKDDTKIETKTQAKIEATTKQLSSMSELIANEKVNESNFDEVATKAFNSVAGGIVGRFLPNGIKEQLSNIAKILTAAELNKLPDAAKKELITRLAHLKEGFDIKTDKTGKTSIENLKETHPDAVAYQASTRLLEALSKASNALPNTSDKSSLLAAALENGIAFEMYVENTDRWAGKVPETTKQVTTNIAEVITSLDPETKSAVFEAAGYLMNWQTPMRTLEASIKAGTTVEDGTFAKVMKAIKVSPEVQEKVTLAFLNHINKKYFDGKLDAKTLEAASKVKDPFKFVEKEHKEDSFKELLKIIDDKAAAQETIKQIRPLLEDPSFYTKSEL
jgi:hypothetical protein